MSTSGRASQLVQIQSLLAKDPANAELQALERDLKQVLDLENDLERARSLRAATGAPPPSRTSAAAVRPTSGGASAAAAEWRAGSTCEAFFQAQWFAATVLQVTPQGINVRFFGYGNELSFPRSGEGTIRALRGGSSSLVPRSALGKGTACQAKYSQDKKWYPAQIVKPTQHGFKVKFTQYGNEEEVPHEYVRLAGAAAASGGASGAAAGAAEARAAAAAAAAAGVIVIPESLQFCATDSEKEKDRKKKRIKAIKSRNKSKVKDMIIQQKQSSWKSFQKKTKGKRGLASSSIFVSPDGVDGKVGVTGSGQGVSEIVKRSKYVLKQ